MTPEEKKAAEGLYRKFENSVEEFGRFFFPHLLQTETPPFHKEIYGLLPNHQYLAIAAPRGHAKTTVGHIVYPIWFALFRSWGNIAVYSASEDFVLREITGKIKKEFETNERLKAFFGDQKTSKWSESYFILKNGISFEGTGITGQLRGGRKALIGLDDLESNETVASEEQRDKLKHRIHKELMPKMLPKSQMIYMGTIIHPMCFLNQILEVPDNGWEKRIYDCYEDGVEAQGHEIWAGWLPHEELQRRKKLMGTFAFQSEYRNKPVTDQNAAIKPEQIRYWKELPQQMSLVIAVDPAYSDEASSDYKVAALVGIDNNSNRYLVHYIRTHNPTGEFIDAILTLFQQYKGQITALGIPCGGTEREFYKSVINKANERKIYPPFVELKNTFITSTGEAKRNKGSRIIASLQPLFEQGKYYINASHTEARDELLNITPNTLPRWDDLIDTMSYAEQILTPVYFDMKEYQEGVEEQEEVYRGQTGYGI